MAQYGRAASKADPQSAGQSDINASESKLCSLHALQGCKATICMPTSTPGIKIDAVRQLGGTVELVGETYSETQTYAQVLHPTVCHTFCARRTACFRLEQSPAV